MQVADLVARHIKRSQAVGIQGCISNKLGSHCIKVVTIGVRAHTIHKSAVQKQALERMCPTTSAHSEGKDIGRNLFDTSRICSDSETATASAILTNPSSPICSRAILLLFAFPKAQYHGEVWWLIPGSRRQRWRPRARQQTKHQRCGRLRGFVSHSVIDRG